MNSKTLLYCRERFQDGAGEGAAFGDVEPGRGGEMCAHKPRPASP